jgi:hypothetical protein
MKEILHEKRWARLPLRQRRDRWILSQARQMYRQASQIGQRSVSRPQLQRLGNLQCVLESTSSAAGRSHECDVMACRREHQQPVPSLAWWRWYYFNYSSGGREQALTQEGGMGVMWRRVLESTSNQFRGRSGKKGPSLNYSSPWRVRALTQVGGMGVMWWRVVESTSNQFLGGSGKKDPLLYIPMVISLWVGISISGLKLSRCKSNSKEEWVGGLSTISGETQVHLR